MASKVRSGDTCCRFLDRMSSVESFFFLFFVRKTKQMEAADVESWGDETAWRESHQWSLIRCRRAALWICCHLSSESCRWSEMLFQGGGRLWGASSPEIQKPQGSAGGNNPNTDAERTWTKSVIQSFLLCRVFTAKWNNKYLSDIMWRADSILSILRSFQHQIHGPILFLWTGDNSSTQLSLAVTLKVTLSYFHPIIFIQLKLITRGSESEQT